MTAQDLHYLRSILGHLREIKRVADMPEADGSDIGRLVLADNIDWLDCFIERNERELNKERPSP